MEETFNVKNPTKKNIDYAFKNLIFYEIGRASCRERV